MLNGVRPKIGSSHHIGAQRRLFLTLKGTHGVLLKLPYMNYAITAIKYRLGAFWGEHIPPLTETK